MVDQIHEMTTASGLQMKFTKNTTNGSVCDVNINQGSSVIAVPMTKAEAMELAAIMEVIAVQLN